MVKVLIVGQTPPPYLGQPIMIQRLLESDMPGVELHHVGVRLSTEASEVGRFGWSKLLTLFTIIGRIWWARVFRGVKVLYYPPAGPVRVTMFRDFAILLPTRWLFSKTIFHFHASGLSELYDRLPGWQRWLFRRAYFRPDAAVRLSTFTPDDAHRLQARREYIIPYGIEDPTTTVARREPSPRQTSDEPLRILFVANLKESKGLLVVIEAVRLLQQRRVPFQLEVMGQWESPAFAEQVHARVAELGLESQVKFLGMLTGTEKFAAFARADVFCFPSFYESEALPVVLIEAMSYGLPIVATRWRGIPSMVVDGETGYLVEPRTIEPVADRLAALAGDAELRSTMSRQARARFLREFTLSRHIMRMRQVFLDMAGRTTATESAEELTQEVADEFAPVEALA